MILKPNMVISGKKCADARHRRSRSPKPPCAALKRYVPSAVPGIAFLSGGQSAAEATEHLEPHEQARPAAVGADVLVRPRAAGRSAEGVGRQAGERSRRARRLLARRAKFNGLARTGSYNAKLEQEAA